MDNDLVKKHIPKIIEQDKRIGELLETTKNECDWQTLFTHPKLLRGYYWKDYRIHSK